MTADVRVRRCSLTIRRRDGWSWGPDPRRKIDAALAGLSAALAGVVADAGLDPSLDATLDGSVRLELSSDGSLTPASREALLARLRTLDRPQRGQTPLREVEGSAGMLAGVALGRTLGRWSRGGQAARVVRGWPEPLVWTWIEAIAAAADSVSAAAAPLDAAAVARIAGTVLRDAAVADRPAAERLLVLLAALTAALGDVVPDPATQRLAREHVGAPPRGGSPVESDSVAATGTAVPPDLRAAGTPETRAEPSVEATHGSLAARALPPAAGEAAGDAAVPLAAADRGASVAPARRARTAEVVPALPLLVLAELARIGYVDALAAAAEAAGLPPGAPAGALAGKVLPRPALGWMRAPAEERAIALAAGDAAGSLAAVARAAGALHPPLACALQAAYAEGRSVRDELLVTDGGDGIVVGEQEGLLPIAWVATEPELEAVLETLGRPPLRRADGFGPFARALSARRALPRLGAPALERHFGAAAGTALGLLVLDLWGPASPLLALERLGDLEARVQPAADALVVAIPRGQRWLDLRRGGLLNSFEVPWLPGGRLEIGTW